MWFLKEKNDNGDWVGEGQRFSLLGGEGVYCPLGHNAECGAIEADDAAAAAAVLGLTFDPLPQPEPNELNTNTES